MGAKPPANVKESACRVRSRTGSLNVNVSVAPLYQREAVAKYQRGEGCGW